MEMFCGKSVFGGIAIGKIAVFQGSKRQVKKVHTSQPKAEIARFDAAKEAAKEQLGELYAKAMQEVGQAHAEIFEVHKMMLDDADYREAVEQIICVEEVAAEYAVAAAGEHFAELFAQMEDAYMRARSADIRDITERLLGILQGRTERRLQLAEPSIILAQDLTPSETVRLDKDKVSAFVTLKGSVNSHTAILARTMGIPALVDLEGEGRLKEERLERLNGCTGIVDGIEGCFYVEPDEKTLERLTAKQKEALEKKERLLSLKGRQTRTKDGRKIALYANIGDLSDLEYALHNDAEGIGLFRSEFLFLGRAQYPTEEEQFQAYKTAVERMDGKPVIVRTLDIGADKQCGYFGLEREENPAMGYRAIRICLDRPEIFRTQLRALLRASYYGNLQIMYPMITSVWEVQRCRALARQVQEELTEAGVPCGRPAQGVMIETPAAVMVSGELAKEVDFFSIGTNDLTQYTLAVDRQNPHLEAFYDAHHPAILRMIEMVAENAHRAGIWVGICGELGADQEMTGRFLEMGIDELSVSPAHILPVRGRILETDSGRK